MIAPSPIAAPDPDRIARHSYAAANGIRLHLAEAGSGNPLVFLHGFPENWYSWRHQFRGLSGQFRLLAPDLRGYGLSDWPATGYDVNTAAADILGLLDTLGIERANLIGHDWGALILWRFAFTYPERCRRLAFLNTPHMLSYDLGPRPLALARNPQLAYIGFFQLRRLPEWLMGANPERFVRAAFRRASYGRRLPLNRPEIAYLANLWGRPGALRGPLAYYRQIETSQRQSLGDRGRKLDLPILFLAGESDPILRPDFIEPMRDQLPDLTVHRIPKCGHWPQAEQPIETNRALERFFS